MSTLVLGSNSFQLVPDVNGDPLIVSPSGSVPSVMSGTGTPAAAPTYGEGTLYVDTTDYILYIYKSAAWTQVGAALPSNLIYVLDKTTTNVAYTGSGPSNTFAYTVPGGTLGTSNMLRLKMRGRWVNAGGGNRQVTITVSYGGTTMWSDTSTSLSSGGDTGWEMDLDLIANNSTTSQKLVGRIGIGGTGTTSTGLSGDLSTDEVLATAFIVGNNASVNSANNQSFNVTVTFSNSGTTWTKYYHTLELL